MGLKVDWMFLTIRAVLHKCQPLLTTWIWKIKHMRNVVQLYYHGHSQTLRLHNCYSILGNKVRMCVKVCCTHVLTIGCRYYSVKVRWGRMPIVRSRYLKMVRKGSHFLTAKVSWTPLQHFLCGHWYRQQVSSFSSTPHFHQLWYLLGPSAHRHQQQMLHYGTLGSIVLSRFYCLEYSLQSMFVQALQQRNVHLYCTT